MAGAVSSVSSETMTALAALRTRFTLLRSTHRDPRQGWYYGGGTCGLLPPHPAWAFGPPGTISAGTPPGVQPRYCDPHGSGLGGGMGDGCRHR